MEKWEWLVDVFTFIGMAVCILIALIAIVWITCFLVKLLVKTFGVKVGKSYDLLVEDINKKSEAKKERNELKRQAKLAHKMEMLNIKLESKQRIHDIKKAKLEGKLDSKENAVMIKLFGDEVPEFETKTKENKKETKQVEDKKQDEESEEVFENLADVVDAVDGEVSTIDAIKPEEETKKQPAKKKTSKKK